ncbi:transposase [Halomonas sp. PR-M31]|uniref:REP-associated tyrosine transposase n=1 Tax=Halomonas sp. PR-M31 TaxID=1471202 RepID=UPI000A5D9C13|nr:transposase [Halomonas sp. PR-M31]
MGRISTGFGRSTIHRAMGRISTDFGGSTIHRAMGHISTGFGGSSVYRAITGTLTVPVETHYYNSPAGYLHYLAFLFRPEILFMLHSHALRKGRRSIPGHIYMITIVTKQRYEWFLDFQYAAVACRNFYADTIGQQGDTLAYVVMPDHVHWLLQLKGELSEVVRLYKAKVSLEIGNSIWQKGFHDHAIRQEEDIRKAARYLVANPLRAGLVDDITRYSYWNAVWL